MALRGSAAWGGDGVVVLLLFFFSPFFRYYLFVPFSARCRAARRPAQGTGCGGVWRRAESLFGKGDARVNARRRGGCGTKRNDGGFQQVVPTRGV